MNNYPTVPVAPIARVLDKYKNEEELTYFALGKVLGLSERRLYGVLRQKKVSFDIADLIVTRTYGPMLWWEDEELSEIYLSANLSDMKLGDHGYRGTYVVRGCRCRKCTKANTDYLRDRKKAA